MTPRTIVPSPWSWLAAGLLALPLLAQDPGPPPGAFGPGGPGFGPPGMGGDRALLKDFDLDKNGRLDQAERKAARESLKAEKAARMKDDDGRPGGGRMPGPPHFEQREKAVPGVRIGPADVTPVPDKVPLYDPSVLRTIFLDFEGDDWEAELEDFSHTDVEVPAVMTVDGTRYPGAGISFRGASSLFGVSAGYKRSLNVAVDAAEPKQRLLGYKTLNLLNAHEDASFLHSVLVSTIARLYLPAPKVNLVRVVINGENWGIYANAQQFDKILLHENFPNAEGVRWKVPGNPRARGGLEWFGEDLAEYKKRFQIKSHGHEEKAWKDLVNLCRVLNETPLAELESRLEPIFDVGGALRFLAVDIVLANGDGYWTRASDYSMFQDAAGRFHVLPHDMNEAFEAGGGMPFGPGPGGRRPGGPPGFGGAESRHTREGGGPPPGMGPPGGPRGPQPGPTLDPLTGLDDKRKPLRSRLLAIPALRERYLRYVKDVAFTALDWKRLGPVVAQYRALIDHEVEIDTRKLSSIGDFRRVTADEAPPEAAASRPGRPELSLRSFAEQRRRYLLDYPEIRALDSAAGAESRAAPAKDR